MSFSSTSAHALEELVYTKNISPSSLVLIHDFIARTDVLDLKHIAVAPTDLNEDGLPEHVLKDTRCAEDHGFCHFWITAENDDHLLVLGEFRARGLAIGHKTSGGIHDIIAFQTPVNDCKYTLYSWEPQSSRYVAKQ